MNRLPSIGFVYLTTTIAAFALGCWWLLQPHWYELPEPDATHARLSYLLDLAKASEGDERQAWLRHCVEIAQRRGAATGDWQFLFQTFDGMHDQSTTLSDRPCVRIGEAWLIGADADGRGLADQQLTVLLRNSAAEPRYFELCWAGEDGSTAELLLFAGEATQLSFTDGASRHVLPGVAPGAYAMLTVQSATPDKLQLVEVLTR